MRNLAKARSDLLAGLPATLRAQLRARAYGLLAMIGDLALRRQAERALELRLPETAKEPPEGRPSLRRVVDEYPIAAMLEAIPAPAHPAAARIEILQAWVLAAALVFLDKTLLDDRDHAVQRPARVARRLATKHAMELLAVRLETPRGDLDEAIEVYEALRARLAKESGKVATYDARLTEVTSLLSRCKAPRLRDTGDRRRDEPPPVVVVDPPVDRRLPDETLRRLGARIVRRVVTLGREVRTEEEAYDYLDDEAVIDFGLSEPGRGIADMLAEHRRLHAEDLAAPGLALTDSASLTAAEARAVVVRAGKALARNAGEVGATLALAALVFGRSVEELAKAALRRTARAGEAFWIDIGGRPALARAPDVSGGEPVVTLLNARLYAMIAPPVLHEPLRRLLASPPRSPELAVGAARTWLQRSAVGHRPPRLERLARFLEDTLELGDVDSAAVALLSGRSCKERPQLFYATTKIAALDEAWRVYRRTHLGLPRVTGSVVVSPVGAPTIGTLKAPSPAAVRDHFARLQERVEACRFRAPSEETILVLHGAVMDHGGALLAFLAGARPHGPAYPSLGERIGRARPSLRVSDKENRSVSAARWIPLPSVATAQIEALQTHMAAMADWFRLSMPGVSAMADGARDGTGPSLFLVDGVARKSVVLTAADLHDRVGTPDGMPRNWSRHFLRGWLVANGAPGPGVDAFMGHGGALGDPYRKTSAASMADLEPIRAALEALCGELRLTAVAGWAK